MDESLKQTFNELARIARVQSAWGKNIETALDEPTLVDLSVALERDRVRRPEEYHYYDDDRFDTVMSAGPDMLGYPRSTAALLKTLAWGDKNTAVMISVLSEQVARSFMPPVDDADEVRALAQKYGFQSIQRLLP